MNGLRLIVCGLGLFVYFVAPLQASFIDVSTVTPPPIFRLEKTEDPKIKAMPKTYVWQLRGLDDQALINKWRAEKPWPERNFLVYSLTAKKDITWGTYEVKSDNVVLIYVTFPVSLSALFTLNHKGADPSVPCLADSSKLTFSLYAPPNFTSPTLLEALIVEDARAHKANSTPTALPDDVTIHKRLPPGYTWGNLLDDLPIG